MLKFSIAHETPSLRSVPCSTRPPLITQKSRHFTTPQEHILRKMGSNEAVPERWKSAINPVWLCTHYCEMRRLLIYYSWITLWKPHSHQSQPRSGLKADIFHWRTRFLTQISNLVLTSACSLKTQHANTHSTLLYLSPKGTCLPLQQLSRCAMEVRFVQSVLTRWACIDIPASYVFVPFLF